MLDCISMDGMGSVWRCLFPSVASHRAFPDAASCKESACQCRRQETGSVPGFEKFHGERHDNPLHCSCLDNPMDRGAWWAMVHGITKSQTRLKCLMPPTPPALCQKNGRGDIGTRDISLRWYFMIFLTLRSHTLEYLQLWTFYLSISISSSFSPFLLCFLP